MRKLNTPHLSVVHRTAPRPPSRIYSVVVNFTFVIVIIFNVAVEFPRKHAKVFAALGAIVAALYVALKRLGLAP